MANQRILRGRPATISVLLTDQDGILQDAVGAVTVGVSRADGSVVLAAGTATTHTSTGLYRVNLTAAQTALLDELTATWTDSGAGTTTTTVDVVGGYYFSVAEARQSDATLQDASRYTDADIVRVRQEVEEECDRITGRAFVPRFRRVVLPGTGSAKLHIPNVDLRTFRVVSLSGTAVGAQTLNSAVVTWSGLSFSDGTLFPYGAGTVVAAYEYGWDSPPSDLKRATLIRLRNRLNISKSGIPDRARFQVSEGTTFGINPIGAGETGITEVDAIYAAYRIVSGQAMSVPIAAGY